MMPMIGLNPNSTLLCFASYMCSAQVVSVCSFTCLTDGIGNMGIFSHRPSVRTLLGVEVYTYMCLLHVCISYTQFRYDGTKL